MESEFYGDIDVCKGVKGQKPFCISITGTKSMFLRYSSITSADVRLDVVRRDVI